MGQFQNESTKGVCVGLKDLLYNFCRLIELNKSHYDWYGAKYISTHFGALLVMIHRRKQEIMFRSALHFETRFTAAHGRDENVVGSTREENI